MKNNIYILGMGVSGLSALKLAVKKGATVFAINTGNPDKWPQLSEVLKWIPREQCLDEATLTDELDQAQLIVVSPGVADENPVVQLAKKKMVPLVSEIEYAYQYCSTPIVAITGTNGKTTTTSMVSRLVDLAGLSAFTGGNIGTAFCEMMAQEKKYDWAILEISSFQLEKCNTFNPQVGAILNISENHMERYDRIEDYALAKWRIFQNQSSNDWAIIPENLTCRREIKLSSSVVEWNENDLRNFIMKFNFSKSKLIGDHNKANFLVCYLIGQAMKLPQLDLMMQKLIDEFKGVYHRIEYVEEYGDLVFYNDAKSTNTLATMTAIQSFQESDDLYLIMGGKTRDGLEDKLTDLDPLASRVKKIFLMGENAERLSVALKKKFSIELCGDLKNCLLAIKHSKVKGKVLFSPGYPSFDQFQNYAHRGDVFKELVKELFSGQASS